VQVQFLELEDIAADPDGLSIQGEKSDEIIYHRSQAEAGGPFTMLRYNFSASASNATTLKGTPTARLG
jgi:hypothetical protein